MGVEIRQRRGRRLAAWAGAACALWLLAGCSGADGTAGSPGPAGPPGGTGPSGPSGPGSALDITQVNAANGGVTIVATITGVGGTPSQPTVSFRLANEFGQPLRGLPPASASFTMAKLVPGRDGGSSQWVSYINRNENPTVASTVPASWGTVAQRQATSQNAGSSSGTPLLTDAGDGTYTFRFATDLGQATQANSPGPGPAIAFEPSLTHRVGLEIRNPNPNPNGLKLVGTNNPVYTYVPATGATGNLPVQRDIVSTADCAACHDKLEFHGGPRTDVAHCVTCHNPGTIDAQSGNSLDMTVMVHKIHMGRSLPSVVASGSTTPAKDKGYTVWGFGGAIHNYNEVVHSQDVRNCGTCHRESNAETPQSNNFQTVINTASCGSCHDNVNFQTGQNHGGIAARDNDCGTCHGPNSNFANGALRVLAAHRIPTAEAAKRFAYEVVSVTNTAPGQLPVATIRVTDPTNGNRPYDIGAAGGPFQTGNASLRLDFAWSTREFANNGANNGTAQPVALDFKSGATANPDGTFTKTATVAIPASGVTGSGVAYLEGRPNVVLPGETSPTSLAVTAAGRPFAITDSSPVARRQVVDIKKCNDCHSVVSFHGNNRNGNTELCAACHNPGATDIARRPAAGGVDGLREQSIDLKWMIHAIHAGGARAAAGKQTVFYGFGSSVVDYANVKYPGDLANCEGCHTSGTYYPVDSAQVLATTFDTGASRSDPADDKATSPTTAACSGCHVSPVAVAHMQQNGGAPGVLAGDAGVAGSLVSFWAKQVGTAGVRNVASTTETCALCHAAGGPADVKKAHGIGAFKFN